MENTLRQTDREKTPEDIPGMNKEFPACIEQKSFPSLFHQQKISQGVH